ncbi:MAG: hypothetical protein ND866_28230, partial [Pyrinomonadaceae bacterium]|nr:hypothetical protein [Pyrinomonadaceae bacterium]
PLQPARCRGFPIGKPPRNFGLGIADFGFKDMGRGFTQMNADTRFASRESLLSAPTSTQARLKMMNEAVHDKLFLADLNATLEDFRYADQQEHFA